MNEIIVIDKRVGIERDKTRVAAYCRVSTDQPGQEESFDTQVQYYQKMISQNPRWEFAGVYADKGVNGTNAEHRPEFMRLMEMLSLVILISSLLKASAVLLVMWSIAKHIPSLKNSASKCDSSVADQ